MAMSRQRWTAVEEGLMLWLLMCVGGRKVSLSPLLFQESAAAMKATPRTPSIATCVCAVTGDTVKGEW